MRNIIGNQMKKIKKMICCLLAVTMLLGGFQPDVVKAGDNIIQNAMSLDLNGSYSGTAQEDGYVYNRLNVPRSGVITITISIFNNYNFRTINLYDNECEKIRYDEIYYDSNRHCNYKTIKYYLRAGTYYIKLQVGNSDKYSLKTNFKEANETFLESQSDSNDILSQAKSISMQKTYHGMIGDGDDQDFYIFKVPFSGNVTVTHKDYTDGVRGDYEILNQQGDRVASFYGGYDSNKGYAEDKDTYWLNKGTYYLKVYNYNRIYNFSIQIKPENGKVDYGTRSKSKATLKLVKFDGVDGYVVQYSISDKFSKRSTKSKTVKRTTLKLSGLNKSKTYYIRVRCYKKWNGKTYYGNYGDTYILWQ